MKVSPVASPHQIPVNGTPESVRTAKAVAAFNAGKSSYDAPTAQAQEIPVQNPSNVAVEELSAIMNAAPAESSDNVTQETAETPVETAPEKPKADPALSRQFAQLARQEKALRAKAQQQDQALKAREAALAAKEAELASKNINLDEYIPRSRLKQDALSVLAEEQVSYEDLTQQILNQSAVNPQIQAHINRLESQIKKLEAANEASQKNYTESQQQAYQAAVKQIRMDAQQLVRSDPNFETIKATNSVSDVVDLITQTYDKDGIVLSVEDACQEVENYLVDEALKITRIGKIKSRLAQAAQPTQVEKTQAKMQTPTPMKTLTNANSSTRKLSSRERALLAFKGELKQ